METIKKMSIKELKDEFMSISQSIEYGGVSKRDLLWQDALASELDERGYEITNSYKIVKA